MIKLVPHNNRVLIKLEDSLSSDTEDYSKSSSGIFIAKELNKEKKGQVKIGQIVASSKGSEDKLIMAGDRVLVSEFAGIEYLEGDTQYRIMTDDQILGFLPEEKE